MAIVTCYLLCSRCMRATHQQLTKISPSICGASKVRDGHDLPPFSPTCFSTPGCRTWDQLWACVRLILWVYTWFASEKWSAPCYLQVASRHRRRWGSRRGCHDAKEPSARPTADLRICLLVVVRLSTCRWNAAGCIAITVHLG